MKINIVKVNHQLGIRVTSYDEGRIKKNTYSLRKIAVGGLMTVGLLTAIVATGSKAISEYKFKTDISSLENAAQEHANDTIEINGQIVNIEDEIKEYIEAKLEANNEINEETQIKLNKEAKDIQEIGKETIKDAVEEHFEEKEGTHFEIYRRDNTQEIYTEIIQVNGGNYTYLKDGNIVDSKPVENPFVNSVIANDTEAIIKGLSDFQKNGLIEEKGKLR